MEKHLTANCGMTPQYKATKRYQELHRRLGLCVSCSRKVKTGMVRCRVCLAKTREQWMTRHSLFCAECRKLLKPEERWRGKRFHKLGAEKRQSRRYPQIHRSAALAYRAVVNRCVKELGGVPVLLDFFSVFVSCSINHFCNQLWCIELSETHLRYHHCLPD